MRVPPGPAGPVTNHLGRKLAGCGLPGAMAVDAGAGQEGHLSTGAAAKGGAAHGVMGAGGAGPGASDRRNRGGAATGLNQLHGDLLFLTLAGDS